jgi:hypothetical protein
MKLGICILVGPIKLWLGTPGPRISIGRLGRPSRKTRVKTVIPIPAIKQKPSPTKVAVPEAKPATFQLDPQTRQDSIDALIALGFRRKQAVARVDAVTAGSSAEEIIKSALRGGHLLSK